MNLPEVTNICYWLATANSKGELAVTITAKDILRECRTQQLPHTETRRVLAYFLDMAQQQYDCGEPQWADEEPTAAEWLHVPSTFSCVNQHYRDRADD